MDREEKIRKLRKLWKHFGTLNCIRVRNANNLTLEVKFVFTCDVTETKKLFDDLGLTPAIVGKKISIKTSFPADILNEAGIKEEKLS